MSNDPAPGAGQETKDVAPAADDQPGTHRIDAFSTPGEHGNDADSGNEGPYYDYGQG